ncbi:MAG: hypothetical protein QW486_07260 [Candidatus Bathyarchaeia archaeon]
MTFNIRENGFKIESRLPTALFNEAPFIYTGPDFMSFPLGMISDIINNKNRSIQRFFPITISKFQGKILVDQMFCFSFFYVNDEDDLIFYLTHPFWFDRSNMKDTMDFFIMQIEGFANKMNCNQIELEIHENFTSCIAYPTSLSHLSYYLNRDRFQADDLKFFQRYGFNEVNSLFCYEQCLEGIEKNLKDKISDAKKYKAKIINQSDFIKIKDKINNSFIKAFSLSTKDLIVSHRLLPPFNKSMFILNKKNKTSMNSSINGFVQWVPNLFELFRKRCSPIPYLHYHNFKDFPFKCGKIINWAIDEERDELVIALIYHTINMMKKRGIKKCQFGFIHNKQDFMYNILKFCGFSKVHTIKLLKRKVLE